MQFLYSALFVLLGAMIFWAGFRCGRTQDRHDEGIFHAAVKPKAPDFMPDDEREYFEELENKKDKKA